MNNDLSEAASGSFSAVIHEWIVIDNEIEELTVGNVITIGFYLRYADEADAEVLTGNADWVRFDEINELQDTIVDVDGLQFLITAKPPVNRHSVGDEVRLAGPRWSVGPYVYESFAIPDITRKWNLLSVARDESSGNWVVDVRPARESG